MRSRTNCFHSEPQRRESGHANIVALQTYENLLGLRGEEEELRLDDDNDEPGDRAEVGDEVVDADDVEEHEGNARDDVEHGEVGDGGGGDAGLHAGEDARGKEREALHLVDVGVVQARGERRGGDEVLYGAAVVDVGEEALVAGAEHCQRRVGEVHLQHEAHAHRHIAELEGDQQQEVPVRTQRRAHALAR